MTDSGIKFIRISMMFINRNGESETYTQTYKGCIFSTSRKLSNRCRKIGVNYILDRLSYSYMINIFNVCSMDVLDRNISATRKVRIFNI